MSSTNETSDNTTIYSKIPQIDIQENEYEANNRKKPKKFQIDVIKQRYPFCIVWTPIPCISWILPCIGHAGICNSDGVIHDFAAPYYVSVDNMAFGNPTKAVLLQLTQKEFAEYDKALELGRKNYHKMDYDFFTNNCHSFIADVLNKLKYKGKDNYNMVDIWWILCTKSKYLSWMDLIKTYFGFLIIMSFFYMIFHLLK